LVSRERKKRLEPKDQVAEMSLMQVMSHILKFREQMEEKNGIPGMPEKEVK
jgi:hypothetical protein